MIRAILIIIVTVICIFVGSSVKNISNLLSIPITPGLSLEAFDPMHIRWAVQSNFVRSTYSTLFQYANNGNIEGNLADKFWWSSEGLHILLKPEIVTSRGEPIVADNVIFTLKRALYLNKSTHADLQQFFSTEQLLDYNLIAKKISPREIIIHAQKNREFLIQALSNPEMSILPTSYGMKIGDVDFSNTTGLYYVTEKTKSEILLRINKKHHKYLPSMAEKVRLVRLDLLSPEVLIQELVQGHIDVIPTWFSNYAGDFIKAAKEYNLNLHKTSDLCLTFLRFSDRGARNIDFDRRKKIAKIIKNNSLSRAKGRTEVRDTYQFFSIYGNSLLSSSEELALKDILQKTNVEGETGQGISLYAPNHAIAESYKKRYKNILPDLQYKVLTAIELDEISENGNTDDLPDIFLGGVDAGFSDDISLIKYILSTGFFNSVISNPKVWLQSYLALDDREKNDEMSKVHSQVLHNFTFVPIYITPYVALSNREWNFKMSSLVASTPYWMIQHE